MEKLAIFIMNIIGRILVLGKVLLPILLVMYVLNIYNEVKDISSGNNTTKKVETNHVSKINPKVLENPENYTYKTKYLLKEDKYTDVKTYETNNSNMNEGFVANEKNNNKPVIIEYTNEYKESNKKYVIDNTYADSYIKYNKELRTSNYTFGGSGY